MNFKPGLWAINPDHLHAACFNRDAKMQALMSGNHPAIQAGLAKNMDPHDSDGESEFQLDYMVERIGPVAVVKVKGTLVEDYHPLNRYYDEASYEEIRFAVHEALMHTGVQAILLDLKTPGGALSGLDSLVSFLDEAGTVKPIYAHASSSMCSAGYWIGTAGKRISSESLAEVGSIGVVSVHASYYRMYKEDGVDLKVFRSGQYKAVGNRFEPLTPEVDAYLQERQDFVYRAFQKRVALSRNFSQVQLEQVTEGRVFYGSEGLANGLIDQVDSFDKVVKDLVERYTRSSQGAPGAPYPGTGKGTTSMKTMKRQVLTQAAQAALASGVALEELQKDASNFVTEEVPDGDAAAGDAGSAAAAAGDEGAAAGDEGAAAGDEGAAAGSAPAPAPAATDLKALLELSSEVGSLKAKNELLAAELESTRASLEGKVLVEKALRDVAAEATNRLQRAVRAEVSDFSSASTEAVLAAYSNALDTLNSTFKTGASAAPASVTDSDTVADVAGVLDAAEDRGKAAVKFGRARN